MTTFNPGDKVTRDKYSGIFTVIHIDDAWAWIRKPEIGSYGSGYLAKIDHLTKYEPPKPKWKPGQVYINNVSGSRVRVCAVSDVGAVGFRLDGDGDPTVPWLSNSTEQNGSWREYPYSTGGIGQEFIIP